MTMQRPIDKEKLLNFIGMHTMINSSTKLLYVNHKTLVDAVNSGELDVKEYPDYDRGFAEGYSQGRIETLDEM